MKHIFSFYGSIIFLSFFFLYLGDAKGYRDAEKAFFKSLIWPVVACEYVEQCNEFFLEDLSVRS